METQTDFTELTVGAEVLLVSERVLGDHISRARIERLTPKQVIASHRGYTDRYWRTDGSLVGARTHEDGWTRPDHLEAWDASRITDEDGR